ncbi:hypothetical protein EZ313_01680 [Ramlibacter henchirensis]|uniref:DUF2846 domain-containing protein n=1 Tax=Ramlibacter henchirensis TaxID=204072 RepID=A0A4Z0C5M6_9BURK|nr:hypothetical protein [Ramlibacter henchirensis]TFZ05409.1 hypothetical protein EZ313_01680 [Ramlibacter henchirensis]
MRRRLLLLLAAGVLAGCGTTTQVKDFTDRSVGYGWLNIKDVEANRLHDVSIYQFRPHTPEPYYPAALKEFKGGYLYWTMALPQGAHKTISASGQRCLGILCSNTTYRYSFGKQGDDVGAVTIRAPGVYHLGSYDLKDVKTGFFEAGKFEAVPAVKAPSRRELLEEILKDAQDEPVIAERIRRELATLR